MYQNTKGRGSEARVLLVTMRPLRPYLRFHFLAFQPPLNCSLSFTHPPAPSTNTTTSLLFIKHLKREKKKNQPSLPPSLLSYSRILETPTHTSSPLDPASTPTIPRTAGLTVTNALVSTSIGLFSVLFNLTSEQSLTPLPRLSLLGPFPQNTPDHPAILTSFLISLAPHPLSIPPSVLPRALALAPLSCHLMPSLSSVTYSVVHL